MSPEEFVNFLNSFIEEYIEGFFLHVRIEVPEVFRVCHAIYFPMLKVPLCHNYTGRSVSALLINCSTEMGHHHKSSGVSHSHQIGKTDSLLPRSRSVSAIIIKRASYI